MLNVLRKQAQSTLIQGVVLVIVIVFVFWGVGANMNNNRNSVATVNGEEISYQEFQRAYDRTVENFRQQFGGQLPPALLEGGALKKQVLAQLIQSEFLRQGGEEMGITVSDLAVQHDVQKMAVFQKDGHFDLTRYKAVLAQNRMTPSSFESGLKADQQIQRVTDAIGSFVVIPDSAVQDWLAYTGEEIQLAYAVLDPVAFEEKVKVDEKELAAWFDKNKEKYRSDSKVRLEYLFFSFDEDGKQVKVSEEELRDRYESEKDSYAKPEQRHARHILVKVDKDATAAVREEKKKKAEEVLALARQGRDFAELAGEYSEGPTKDRGGDLGFFARGRRVPAFDEAVFSLKSGEVSGIVETPFGYHIIKLEEIRPAATRTFDQVKDNLAASMKKEKGRSLTFKRGSTTYEEIMRAGSLDKYAQLDREKVRMTDFFTRRNPVRDIPADPKFLEAAFSLNKGELSSLVELSNGYAIVFVNDIEEPAVPPREEVRKRVVADFTREKAVELAGKAADDLLAAGREKNGLKAAAGPDITVETSAFLKRSAAAGKDVPPAQVIRDGFALPWKEKLAPSPVRVGTRYYVYEIVQRRLSSEDVDKTRSEEVRKQLLGTARRELTRSWLARVQEHAEIWTNDTLLK
jgi:peptidyl-prolyl cis-trans isomerase D